MGQGFGSALSFCLTLGNSFNHCKFSFLIRKMACAPPDLLSPVTAKTD